jgi:hypothetical protein
MRASSFSKKRSVLPARFPYHGGLRQFAAHPIRAWSLFAEIVRFACRRPVPNHGGLTPAALVNVRLCTANVVIFQRTGVVHQERLA